MVQLSETILKCLPLVGNLDKRPKDCYISWVDVILHFRSTLDEVQDYYLNNQSHIIYDVLETHQYACMNCNIRNVPVFVTTGRVICNYQHTLYKMFNHLQHGRLTCEKCTFNHERFDFYYYITHHKSYHELCLFLEINPNFSHMIPLIQKQLKDVDLRTQPKPIISHYRNTMVQLLTLAIQNDKLAFFKSVHDHIVHELNWDIINQLMSLTENKQYHKLLMKQYYLYSTVQIWTAYPQRLVTYLKHTLSNHYNLDAICHQLTYVLPLTIDDAYQILDLILSYNNNMYDPCIWRVAKKAGFDPSSREFYLFLIKTWLNTDKYRSHITLMMFNIIGVEVLQIADPYNFCINQPTSSLLQILEELPVICTLYGDGYDKVEKLKAQLTPS